MRRGKRPDAAFKAQAVVHAAVHGDKEAAKAFKVSGRTLREYKALARDDASDVAKELRAIAAALQPEARAADVASSLRARFDRLSDIIIAKAERISEKQPQALEALNGHARDILDHVAALAFLDRRFGPADEAGDAAPPAEDAA